MLCWLYSWPQCFEVCTLHYSKAVQKPSKSQMIPLFMAIARSYVKVPAGRMRCAEEPWHWVSKPFDIIQHLSFNVFSALKIGLSPISIAFKTCVFSPKKNTEIFSHLWLRPVMRSGKVMIPSILQILGSSGFFCGMDVSFRVTFFEYKKLNLVGEYRDLY